MIEELHTIQDASTSKLSSLRIEVVALRRLEGARVRYRFE